MEQRSPKVAARKRRKHERGIQDETDLKRQLRRAWSWVLAELAHNPERTEQALTTITDLARDLNGRSTR